MTTLPLCKGKVCPRNNLSHKLSNSNWGPHPHALRQLSIVFLFSKYGVPQLKNYIHSKNFQVALNETKIVINSHRKFISHYKNCFCPIKRQVNAEGEKKKPEMEEGHFSYGISNPLLNLI